MGLAAAVTTRAAGQTERPRAGLATLVEPAAVEELDEGFLIGLGNILPQPMGAIQARQEENVAAKKAVTNEHEHE